MKKALSLLLLACMLFTLTACGSTAAPAATEAPAEATEAPAEATETPADATETPTEVTAAEYKLGMGVSVSLDSSETNKAQVDATVAAVVTDAEGKIVLCRIDCAQNKMDVTGGAVDTEATYITKRDLKFDYNMVKYSDATLEWFEQVENLENWVVGKTAEDIANIETKVNEEGYNVAVDEELFASCSISLEAFQDAIVKACNDEKGSTFTTADAFTLGVSAISNSKESVAAADSEDGNAMVKMYTEFGAAAVGADGKILAALTDAIQPKITVSAEGDCQVNMTVTLRMEYVTTSMSFPLPANATGITLNGASVSTSKTSSATMVDISRVVSGITGEIPLNFSFTLPKSVGVVTVDKERKLQLSVELLSGFEFPVEQLSFVITETGPRRPR